MEIPTADTAVFLLAHNNNKKKKSVQRLQNNNKNSVSELTHYGQKAGEGVVLILTRKVGETLVIGDEVEVTVLSMKGNQIRLGVKAPKEVAVHREEIARKLDNSRDNEVSASAS